MSLQGKSKEYVRPLPLPEHYRSDSARDHKYTVADISALARQAENWRRQHGFQAAGQDRERIHLLLIDQQVDFSFPEGLLYVAGRSGTGAMDAQERLVHFLYRYLHIVSQVTCTLDSHLPYQIFFPGAHLRSDGTHPEAHTVITAEDYARGRYRPDPAIAEQLGTDTGWLQKQYLHYCRQLEISGKYELYLWPYHCMLGSSGHRLAGVVEEARLFHSFARGAADLLEIKGHHPLTEHYSIFSPEVTTCWDSRPIPGVEKNTGLIHNLMKADYVLLAGLASSHCVKESIADLLGEIRKQDPSLAGKVYILRDCTAAVVIPGGPDFTSEAEQALQNFQDAGMHVVDSTTPIESWPGFQLKS